uniref:Uncharacterized protein n=1 Tax=Acanthochromis polyacanthus TaxID=80966 RepID=A0A3Q1F6R3_9TELE
MKPPPRARVKPNRNLRGESENCSGKVACRWQRAEQTKLLRALQRLSRTTGAKEDIDCAFLAKYVPTRSISEVTFHSGLKMWEEKKVRKPIEDWTNMASAVTGSLEETISKAFSQKPGTNTSHPRVLLKTPPPTLGQARRLQAQSQVVRVPNGKIRPPQQQPSPTAGRSPSATSTSQSQNAEQPTTIPSTSASKSIFAFYSTNLYPNSVFCPAESAIVLDLLMSLPEQLPLLDCNKLRKHLIQVRSAAYKQTDHYSNTSGDADMMGRCPPLNPFMVPLKLLMNR